MFKDLIRTRISQITRSSLSTQIISTDYTDLTDIQCFRIEESSNRTVTMQPRIQCKELFAHARTFNIYKKGSEQTNSQTLRMAKLTTGKLFTPDIPRITGKWRYGISSSEISTISSRDEHYLRQRSALALKEVFGELNSLTQ